MTKVRLGLIGSGFIADLHAAAVKMVPELDLVVVDNDSLWLDLKRASRSWRI